MAEPKIHLANRIGTRSECWLCDVAQQLTVIKEKVTCGLCKRTVRYRRMT